MIVVATAWMRQASSNYKNKKIRNALMTYSLANPSHTENH